MNVTAPQSSSATIRRVTGITAIHHAGSIDVCREGSKVALHIQSTDGVILVHMDERPFIRGCRGERDANGNPFRSFEQLDAEQRHREEVAVVPEPQHRQPPRRKRVLSDETRALYERIAARVARGATWRKASAAEGDENIRMRAYMWQINKPRERATA